MAVTLSAKAMRAVERQLYTRSFYEFVKAAWPVIDPGAEFKDNWHIKVLCDHLEAVANGTILRLLINICPGSGKSQIINVLYPAWLWTHSPSKRIISASHAVKLAIRDSTKCRRLIESDWYQGYWPIQLSDDQNAKAAFENKNYGAREATPMSSMTGSRGNLVILDDPHSVDDAKSEAYRHATVDTFRETIPTRINDPARDAIIVVMQRLHMEDVSGFILENPNLGYDHLCIPYICDGVDRPATKIGWKDHRREGEHMFPQHFRLQGIADQKPNPDTFIRAQKAILGSYGFAGQYQQNPIPVGDGFFKIEWFNRYRAGDLPPHLHYYLTTDHAPSGKGDYNVARIWGVDVNRNIWLIDSFRKRCGVPEFVGVQRGSRGETVLRQTGILPLIRKWQPLKWFPENDLTWTANREMIQAWMIETDTFVSIDPLPTKGSGDKVGKAQAYQAMAEMGLVHLPEGEIGDEALEEYAHFPAGKHDDMVDADGAIARVLRQAQGAWVAPEEPKPVRDDDWQAPSFSQSSDSCFG